MKRGPAERRIALDRGRRAEAWVARQLELQGWRILARNWRGGGGEIDLIAGRGGVLRFVEVKARQPDDPSGVESITADKQRRLARVATAWLQAYGEPDGEAAFLVAVVTTDDETGWSAEWIDDAFDG